MARPKAAEKRDRQVNVALTQHEFDQLRGRAAAAGLRPSDYARAVLLRRRIVAAAASAASTVDRLTVSALARIGANLNQAVRQLHMFNHVPPPDLEPLLRDLRAILAKMTADGS